MAIQLDEINTATTKYIMPGIVDNFFKSDPLLAYLKKNRWKVWEGGPQIQENYLFKPMIGGAYKLGATFDISKRQTKSGLLFDPRFYEVGVTEYKEDVLLRAAGPTAAFSIVEADLADAALTMSAMLANDLYRHGQAIGAVDRTASLNGLEEALADGINNTFSGVNFTSYGGQTRADVAPALNSPTGLITASVPGAAITYRVLEHSYQSCVVGDEAPKIGITTNRAMGFINENFAPQYKIDTTEPEIGYTGIKFKTATIMQGQYVPGQDGVNDPIIGNSLNSTETFWWLNPGGEDDKRLMTLYFASAAELQFGWTGFKVAQDNTVLAGQILFGGNFTVRAPRLMRGLFGITN